MRRGFDEVSRGRAIKGRRLSFWSPAATGTLFSEPMLSREPAPSNGTGALGRLAFKIGAVHLVHE